MVKFYFQSIDENDYSEEGFYRLKNKYLFRKRLKFQLGSFWKLVLRNNIFILEFNPRIISNWIILILRASFGFKTVVWGHVYSKNNIWSNYFLRRVLLIFTDGFITYTEMEKLRLEKFYKKPIYIAYNSLYRLNQLVIKKKPTARNIICISRLISSKKPLLLIKAFENALNQLPSDTKLILVGDGELKKEVEEYIINKKLTERVILKGEIYNYDLIKDLYQLSALSIIPGTAGLSVIQSLSFNTPIICSINTFHGPEFDLLNQNNSLLFKNNNEQDLSNKIIYFFENYKKFLQRNHNTIIERSHHIEQMAEAFIALQKDF